MKSFVSIILLFLIFKSSCQNKTDDFNFDFSEFEQIARDSLKTWYDNDSWILNNSDSIKDLYLARDLFQLNDLMTRSIPFIDFVYGYNNFHCKTRIKDILDFTTINPLNQKVMIYTKDEVYVWENFITQHQHYSQEILYFKHDSISQSGTGFAYFFSHILFDLETPVFYTPFGVVTIEDNVFYIIKIITNTNNSITYKLIEGDYYINEVLGEKAINFLIENNKLPLQFERISCNVLTNKNKEIIRTKYFKETYFK